MNIQELGRAGEAIALACYRADGYDCLARRYRKGRGELDLVLRRGALLVFVEVKTRRGEACGRAAEAVSARKLLRMRRAAREYLYERPPTPGTTFRFDVAAIDFRRDMGGCSVELLHGVV